MIAIYARQSLDKKDSLSIESQIELCLKEIDDSTQEYRVYKDKGYSGKNTNRPDFERMMNDIKAGLINKVIVYKLDRFSRSLLDFVNIYADFDKNNVEFISHTEKFDTSTPIGKTMLEITMSFAQLERRTIQQRVEDNYYKRGKKGFFMGGPDPIGYTKEATKVDGIKTSILKENADQIPYIQKMYELYAETNMSLGKISDYLNDNNFPAAQGGKWDSCKVSRILRSPLYVKADADIYSYYLHKGCTISNDITEFVGTNGCYLYGKRSANERKYTKVENHVLSIGLHNGVINSRQWLIVQYKLDKNKQLKNSGRGKHTWLSGISKCGYCEYAVSVINAGYGDKKYFNCRGKTNLKICGGHSEPIYVNEVEEHVKKALFEKVEALKKVKLTIQSEDDAKVNLLKLQILEIDNKIEAFVDRVIDAEPALMKEINARVQSLSQKRQVLLDELRRTSVISNNSVSAEHIIKKVNEWDSLDIEERKAVCQWLIKQVKIFDDEINIEWKVLPST